MKKNVCILFSYKFHLIKRKINRNAKTTELRDIKSEVFQLSGHLKWNFIFLRIIRNIIFTGNNAVDAYNIWENCGCISSLH